VDQTERLLLAELDDRVEQIFGAIEQLHEAVDDGKAKRELLEAIFRDVHSLKAVAGSNGFDSLSRKYLIDAAYVLERHSFVARDVESGGSNHHLKLSEEYLKFGVSG